jgi:hypothetical protein
MERILVADQSANKSVVPANKSVVPFDAVAALLPYHLLPQSKAASSGGVYCERFSTQPAPYRQCDPPRYPNELLNGYRKEAFDWSSGCYDRSWLDTCSEDEG